jgi:hypothetical protein
MEWTQFAAWLAGIFVGSFLMTAWQNERKRRLAEKNRELYTVLFNAGRFYPPATSEPSAPPKN